MLEKIIRWGLPGLYRKLDWLTSETVSDHFVIRRDVHRNLTASQAALRTAADCLASMKAIELQRRTETELLEDAITRLAILESINREVLQALPLTAGREFPRPVEVKDHSWPRKKL